MKIFYIVAGKLLFTASHSWKRSRVVGGGERVARDKGWRRVLPNPRLFSRRSLSSIVCRRGGSGAAARYPVSNAARRSFESLFRKAHTARVSLPASFSTKSAFCFFFFSALLFHLFGPTHLARVNCSRAMVAGRRRAGDASQRNYTRDVPGSSARYIVTSPTSLPPMGAHKLYFLTFRDLERRA